MEPVPAAATTEAWMTSTKSDLDSVLVGERELWLDGPPHDLFRRLRAECPVHWTERITEFPEEAGYWSVTTAEDIHAVSRGFRPYLSGPRVMRMDPPKHDRLKALFQAGFTPKRIADHEDAIRQIVTRVLDRLDGRETCDLV